MTVKATNNREDYLGNGIADTFSFSWRVFDPNEVSVYIRPSGGDEVKVSPASYTVAGVGNKNGGNVTFSFGPPAAGTAITIIPNFEYLQQTDLRNQGVFYPEVHEDQFDRQTMMSKQLSEAAGRSVKMPVTIKPTEFNPVLPAGIKGKAHAIVTTNEHGDGFSDEFTMPDIQGLADAAEQQANRAEQEADRAEQEAGAAQGSAQAAESSASEAENYAEIALTAAAEDTLLFFAGESNSTATFVTSSRVVSVTDGEYLGYPTWNIEVKND